MKIAVLVNDMGEINIDASEIKNSRLIQEEAQMVELHNGCICCSLRGDLLKTVKALGEEQSFDYLVIESTGISEPLPVAQTFTMDIDQALTKNGTRMTFQTLSNFARVDTMVTVVDALNVYDVLGSIETLAETNVTGMIGNTGLRSQKKEKEESKPAAPAFWTALKAAAWHASIKLLVAASNIGGGGGFHLESDKDEEDDRSIVQLMLDQIEFADVIILSKAPLLEKPEAISEIKCLLQRLNPNAKVIVPMQEYFKDLPMNELLNTGLFDMERAEASLVWQLELKKEKIPETLEYGITSMVFRNHTRPFHPSRLKATLAGFGHYDTSIAAATAAASRQGGESGEIEKRQPSAGSTAGPFRGVVRAKGRFWIASAHSHPIDFQSSGRIFNLTPSENPFLDALPKDQFDDLARKHFAIALKERKEDGRWHEDSGYGDRDSELIFIGVGLDKARIVEALQDALVSDEELAGGPALWKDFEDVYWKGLYFRPYCPAMSVL